MLLSTTTTDPPKTRRRQRTAIPSIPVELALTVIFAALYTSTRTHLNTFDAVSYANQIEHLYRDTGDPHWLFHPHHLLFNAAGYAATAILAAFGLPCDSLTALEGINAFAGALGIAIMYGLLRRTLGLGVPVSLLTSILVGLSYGYWVAATDGRVNMVSSVLLLAAFWQVVVPPTGRRSVVPIIGAAAAAALATLFHESAALFVPAGCVAIGAWPANHIRIRIFRMILFLVIWASVVAEVYVVVGYGLLHLYSIAGIKHWTEEYSELGWWWDFHIARNLHLDLAAQLRAVSVEPSRAADHGAMRRLYTASRFVIAILGFSCVVGVLRQSRKNRVLVASSVCWIATEAAFFTVWSPGYFIFWLPVLFPLAVLAASGLDTFPLPQQRPRMKLTVAVTVATSLGLAAACTSIGLENARASILPHMRAGCSPYQRIADDIRQHTQQEDIVIVTGIGDLAECEVNIPYFADRPVISLHTEFTRNHESAMRTKLAVETEVSSTLQERHRVYMLDEAHDPVFASRLLVLKHPQASPEILRAMFARWPKRVAWWSSHGPVWELLQQQEPSVPTRKRRSVRRRAGNRLHG